MMTQTTANSQDCPIGYTQGVPRNSCPSGGPAVNCPIGYAKVLYELHISREAIQKSEDIFAEIPQLRDVFVNPTIREEEKFKVIDQVFPEEIRNFLKVACRHRRMDLIGDIFKAYYKYSDKQNRILNAVLTCAKPPSEVQIERMKAFLCKKYNAVKAYIEIRQDEALLGGFVLRVGNDEYDWSLQGRLNRLEQKLTWR